MNRKHLFLGIAALLVAGGLWRSQTALQTPAQRQSNTDGSSTDVAIKTTNGQPTPRQMLLPPDPVRKFQEFTPEQRVEFARKGHGPGG